MPTIGISQKVFKADVTHKFKVHGEDLNGITGVEVKTAVKTLEWKDVTFKPNSNHVEIQATLKTKSPRTKDGLKKSRDSAGAEKSKGHFDTFGDLTVTVTDSQNAANHDTVVFQVIYHTS